MEIIRVITLLVLLVSIVSVFSCKGNNEGSTDDSLASSSTPERILESNGSFDSLELEFPNSYGDKIMKSEANSARNIGDKESDDPPGGGMGIWGGK